RVTVHIHCWTVIIRNRSFWCSICWIAWHNSTSTSALL
uniref:Uncharacterized protein n=1 Tax=Amphimedon queenslandica TaxID=400682 RepID=A0A1X7UU09_AMPQE